MRKTVTRLAMGLIVAVLAGACRADLDGVTVSEVWRNFRSWDGSRASIRGFLSTDREANAQDAGLVCETLGPEKSPRTGGDCVVYVGVDISEIPAYRTAGRGMWTSRPVVLEGTIRNFAGWGERPEFVVSDWSLPGTGPPHVRG